MLRSLNKIYIFSDDVVRAVKKLKLLGSGLEVVATGSSQFIYAIPGELSMDHTTLLQEVLQHLLLFSIY